MPDEPIRIRNGDLWAWKWGDWTSPAFPYLEKRAWTPAVIAGRLCFVAADTAIAEELADPHAFAGARWCVVWGAERGPWFDDATNLAEYHDRPIYLARERNGGGHLYTVVWGDRRSQAFDHPIGFVPSLAGITIRALDPRGSLSGPDIPAIWQSV